MTNIELINVLLSIKPDIKVKISTGIPIIREFNIIDGKAKLNTREDPEFTYDVNIDGLYITYNETETTRPTKDEIMAVINGN